MTQRQCFLFDLDIGPGIRRINQSPLGQKNSPKEADIATEATIIGLKGLGKRQAGDGNGFPTRTVLRIGQPD